MQNLLLQGHRPSKNNTDWPDHRGSAAPLLDVLHQPIQGHSDASYLYCSRGCFLFITHGQATPNCDVTETVDAHP